MRVVYSAPPGCPEGDTFLDRVRARTTRGRFAGADERARVFEVTLSSDDAGGGFHGQIAFVDSGEQRVQRDVAGAACDEVVSLRVAAPAPDWCDRK